MKSLPKTARKSAKSEKLAFKKEAKESGHGEAHKALMKHKKKTATPRKSVGVYK